MDNIIHIKLLTGEDIFGQEITITKDYVVVREVLIMETIQSDESKYMFMTRYSPFSNESSISIPYPQVVFISPVTEAVKDHYIHALQFCLTRSDENFQEGISAATKYLKKVLAKQEPAESIDEELSPNDINDWIESVIKPSTTKH
jgi:hypothetical protein